MKNFSNRAEIYILLCYMFVIMPSAGEYEKLVGRNFLKIAENFFSTMQKSKNFTFLHPYDFLQCNNEKTWLKNQQTFNRHCIRRNVSTIGNSIFTNDASFLAFFIGYLLKVWY